MSNDSPNDTPIHAFSDLEHALVRLGLVEDARWLHEALAIAYATSSEMLGELGATVRRIHGTIPSEAMAQLRPQFDECVRVVRIAWPDFTVAIRSTE